MERSTDVLAAGLLEVADESLSSKFFLRQVRSCCDFNYFAECKNLLLYQLPVYKSPK